MPTHAKKPRTGELTGRAARKRSTTSAKRTERAPSVNGHRHLVIVESPAKARTVGRFLGGEYTVKASMGHVRDLPEGKLGVNVEDDFNPAYVVIKGKKTVIGDLKKAGERAASIYLATDPDREGEAISWHLVQATGWRNIPIRRVVFHQITPDAVREAFAHDRDIDMHLVNAQQARRILDRLVGYQLSPLLWRKVQRGLSAGRVQSVALRMIVERDREIASFVPREYWSLAASLRPIPSGGAFTASLHSRVGEKKRFELPNKAIVDDVTRSLAGASYAVTSVTTREVRRRPTPPFITSTLQQEAGRQLGFSARKTMTVAQHLYEGMPVGSEGSIGLITYMRTDSPKVAADAVAEVREYIRDSYGPEYVPPSPRAYTTRSKVAQEAHEAIRPTGIARHPLALQPYLDRDHWRLYDLIWKRMVASQMTDARLESTQVDVTAQPPQDSAYLFRTTGSVLKFPGFRALYVEARDEDPRSTEQGGRADEQDAGGGTLPSLPELRPGQALHCTGLEGSQHFTEPPPRYTEASLIKVLEERGIGRPSTYAPTIGTLDDRGYISRDRGRLQATRLGQVVNEQLLRHFPDIMDPDFTAQLEERLDGIARGDSSWVPVLRDFYLPFTEALERAQGQMTRIRVEEETDETCPQCGQPLVIKQGRFGQFMACTGFPTCRFTKPVLKRTGVACDYGGEIVQRKGRGRPFYGCIRYPECKFTSSRVPEEVACPLAGSTVMAGVTEDKSR